MSSNIYEWFSQARLFINSATSSTLQAKIDEPLYHSFFTWSSDMIYEPCELLCFFSPERTAELDPQGTSCCAAATFLSRFSRAKTSEREASTAAATCLCAVAGCAHFQNLHRLDIVVHIGMHYIAYRCVYLMFGSQGAKEVGQFQISMYTSCEPFYHQSSTCTAALWSNNQQLFIFLGWSETLGKRLIFLLSQLLWFPGLVTEILLFWLLYCINWPLTPICCSNSGVLQIFNHQKESASSVFASLSQGNWLKHYGPLS